MAATSGRRQFWRAGLTGRRDRGHSKAWGGQRLWLHHDYIDYRPQRPQRCVMWTYIKSDEIDAMENFVIIHSDSSSHHHHGGFVAASLASPVMEPLSLRLSFLHKMLPNCLLLLLFSQLLATATFVYGFCWISLSPQLLAAATFVNSFHCYISLSYIRSPTWWGPLILPFLLHMSPPSKIVQKICL